MFDNSNQMSCVIVEVIGTVAAIGLLTLVFFI